MIKRVYFVKGNPSIESESDGKEFSKKVEELFFSLNEDKCEDCDCECDIEEDLEDYDEDFEEENDFEKEILIERNLIEDKVYEFNFYDSETSELIWSYYGDYNLNVAKDIFLEEHDHLDVTFYLAE